MGKQRPKSHVIEDKAYMQFESSLPESWSLRRQDKDIGIDREVEIFENEKSTGIIFKVQIIGYRNPKIYFKRFFYKLFT